MSDLSFLANLPGQAIFKNQQASGNFGQTNAGSNYTNENDPDLLRQLAQIRQHDPNASVQYAGPTEGNSSGTYSINFDQDKLPKISHDMGRVPDAEWNKRQLNHGGSDAILHSLIDPTNQRNSDYGQITPYSNITTQQVKNPDTSLLGKVGPMLPLLAAGGVGMLGGALPGAFGLDAGGVLSGAGELGASAGVGGMVPSAMGNAATKFATSVPGQLANDKFNPGSAAGLVGAGAGLPSWVAQFLQNPALMQLLKKGS